MDPFVIYHLWQVFVAAEREAKYHVCLLRLTSDHVIKPPPTWPLDCGMWICMKYQSKRFLLNLLMTYGLKTLIKDLNRDSFLNKKSIFNAWKTILNIYLMFYSFIKLNIINKIIKGIIHSYSNIRVIEIKIILNIKYFVKKSLNRIKKIKICTSLLIFFFSPYVWIWKGIKNDLHGRLAVTTCKLYFFKKKTKRVNQTVLLIIALQLSLHNGFDGAKVQFSVSLFLVLGNAVPIAKWKTLLHLLFFIYSLKLFYHN